LRVRAQHCPHALSRRHQLALQFAEQALYPLAPHFGHSQEAVLDRLQASALPLGAFSVGRDLIDLAHSGVQQRADPIQIRAQEVQSLNLRPTQLRLSRQVRSDETHYPACWRDLVLLCQLLYLTPFLVGQKKPRPR
jgi:hypothetical protein